MKVWIDAGHGGSASGAVNGSRMEKNDTLRLAKLVQAAFERCGVQTVMTRTSDVYLSLADRTNLENRSGCDLAVSLHRNSASADACGVEIWLHHAAPASYVQWAQLVLKELQAVGISKNRGVKKGYIGDTNADYAVNRDTKAPSMMIELGFISNAGDNRDYDAKLTQYAEAIVKGCCSWKGVAYQAPNGETPQGKTLYRVQVGAFQNRENAQRMKEQLEKDGYTAFITQS